MNYDTDLAPITGQTFAREQILANAVALYPHLVREVANARHVSSGQVEPREVFQILATHGSSGWSAVLIYGVPRIKGVLAKGDTVWDLPSALDRLLKATGDMLSMRFHDELHISQRSATNATSYAIFNKEFL
ncbi:hypothetical protein CKM354_001152000 [Cercospora kikuchii]|uniref:Uncharacterized protein n=1 Tax=Cercospora kikuchii TaxID=84275 RepID=A0A9P3CT91_9PEZI|nr:uncharacterized protein CKM354_001152000 [Cercospora kikuchii]GIZ48461.1 hypothetical protein CKM354_001152000 [Cercospora kikuchii]